MKVVPNLSPRMSCARKGPYAASRARLSFTRPSCSLVRSTRCVQSEPLFDFLRSSLDAAPAPPPKRARSAGGGASAPSRKAAAAANAAADAAAADAATEALAGDYRPMAVAAEDDDYDADE